MGRALGIPFVILIFSAGAFAGPGETDKALYGCLSSLNKMDASAKSLVGNKKFLTINNSHHIDIQSADDIAKTKAGKEVGPDTYANSSFVDDFANGRYFVTKDSIVFDPDGTGKILSVSKDLTTSKLQDYKSGTQLKRIRNGDSGSQYYIRLFITSVLGSLKSKIDDPSKVAAVTSLSPASASGLKKALEACNDPNVLADNGQGNLPKLQEVSDALSKGSVRGHSYLDYIGGGKSATADALPANATND